MLIARNTIEWIDLKSKIPWEKVNDRLKIKMLENLTIFKAICIILSFFYLIKMECFENQIRIFICVILALKNVTVRSWMWKERDHNSYLWFAQKMHGSKQTNIHLVQAGTHSIDDDNMTTMYFAFLFTCEMNIVLRVLPSPQPPHSYAIYSLFLWKKKNKYVIMHINFVCNSKLFDELTVNELPCVLCGYVCYRRRQPIYCDVKLQNKVLLCIILFYTSIHTYTHIFHCWICILNYYYFYFSA